MADSAEYLRQVRLLAAHIPLIIRAHDECAKEAKNQVRHWNQTTPYSIHPIWCAMTFLAETTLPKQIYRYGALALLWHDVLEDTTMRLPAKLSKTVKDLIQEMTFASFNEERILLPSRSKEAKLLKAYDKVSNLLDSVWMEPPRLIEYIQHTQALLQFVEEQYGQLNIVHLGKAICKSISPGVQLAPITV